MNKFLSGWKLWFLYLGWRWRRRRRPTGWRRQSGSTRFRTSRERSGNRSARRRRTWPVRRKRLVKPIGLKLLNRLIKINLCYDVNEINLWIWRHQKYDERIIQALFEYSRKSCGLTEMISRQNNFLLTMSLVDHKHTNIWFRLEELQTQKHEDTY